MTSFEDQKLTIFTLVSEIDVLVWRWMTLLVTWPVTVVFRKFDVMSCILEFNLTTFDWELTLFELFPEISGPDWPQKIYVKNWYKVPHFDIQFAFNYIRNKTHSPFNVWVNKICKPRFIGQELVSDTDWKYF